MKTDANRREMAPGLALVERLQALVGRHDVLTDPGVTLPYRTGIRFGAGPVLAVVRPRSLVNFWRVLQVCVAANSAIIIQAANTGLTGGSTPFGDDYGRDIVLISPQAINGVHVLEGGAQVLCLPGATLNQLEMLLKPLRREPHSVIGSSCIGASVMGGVCNNSGGALIRRGPAYTELALYARLGANGQLDLVNHLGIAIAGEPETVLQRIENGDFAATDVLPSVGTQASDSDYQRRVRDIDAATPARYNADPERLFEASGSAGKLAVFAVRLDTFPSDTATRSFYLGTNDPAEFARLRRSFLGSAAALPIAAEYMHRDCFDIADYYGKDTLIALRILGTKRLPRLYRAKNWLDRIAARVRLGAYFSDRALQAASRLLGDHLPPRMRAFRNRFAHHLILKVVGDDSDEARRLLREIFPSATGDVFECTQAEASSAFLHRFVAAGAAIRYRQVHGDEVEDIVALDLALPRNTWDWPETLPLEIENRISHKLYYGHFFCHVFHQDYIVRKGCDPHQLERELCGLLDRRGAEYPAEHNFGHLYAAKPALADHYRSLDPCNAFNPGIGKLSKLANWQHS